MQPQLPAAAPLLPFGVLFLGILQIGLVAFFIVMTILIFSRTRRIERKLDQIAEIVIAEMKKPPAANNQESGLPGEVLEPFSPRPEASCAFMRTMR